MSADSSWSVADLRAFERDLLFAVRALERQDSPPKGLAVKSYLDAEYPEEINHSRLYQNLDKHVERGLLEKAERDGRTNEYATTEQARTLLNTFARRRAEQTGIELESDSAPSQTDAFEQEGES
ncbi:helix-turn-helix domain-containing protein [Halorussus salinus]|uniref:helix-turn-helix transcriptional regulator n=1 Tax=Halorussus salinus TaxID=1364935 RepID=UPI001092F7CE|nr:helix-turn-helix transcriptional regulator [Halorussus salinus]